RLPASRGARRPAGLQRGGRGPQARGAGADHGRHDRPGAQSRQVRRLIAMTAYDSAAAASSRSPKGARTRARLVEAAKEVFAEQGLPDARIADIAERAGVSYGSFYHYFDSKEALFREIADELDDRL